MLIGIVMGCINCAAVIFVRHLIGKRAVAATQRTNASDMVMSASMDVILYGEQVAARYGAPMMQMMAMWKRSGKKAKMWIMR